VTTTDIPPSLQSVLQPNIDRNVSSHPGWTGTVQVKELDWFDYVASGDDSGRLAADNARRWVRQNVTDTITTIQQTMDTDGFDMIITTDTIYHPSLLVPLLATLRSFSLVSSRPPTVYVALERRDPRLIAHALESAKDAGFEMKRIAQGRVEKCLAKSGWGGWLCDVDVGEGGKKDWEGVEVWKWRFTGA
jgi:predicted nicotinamide N-methyase